MNNTKFTVNALLIITTIFSAIIFFFTVVLFDMTESSLIMNDYYPIGESGYGIRYATREPNGVYKGSKTAGELVAEGRFAAGDGLVLDGETLYVSEYTATDLKLMLSNVVKIDLETGEKELLFKDAVLLGQTGSGEMVIAADVMIPAVYPETNSLARLYSLSSSELRPESKKARVIFVDPGTLGTVCSINIEDVFGESFDSRFAGLTLDEIKAQYPDDNSA